MHGKEYELSSEVVTVVDHFDIPKAGRERQPWKFLHALSGSGHEEDGS